MQTKSNKTNKEEEYKHEKNLPEEQRPQLDEPTKHTVDIPPETG